MTSAISGSGSNATSAVATGPTATAVSGSGGVVTKTISGLSTGLDTGAIIAQLVAAQRANREGPINQQIAKANASLLAYSQIQADTTLLQAAARTLSAPTAWQALTAQSSNPNAVKARALADKDRIASSLLALAGRHQGTESGRTGRLVDLAG